MEDSPQRRFATQRVRRTNVTENLSVSVGQTFATVPMRKIRHTMVIGWGRGVGLGLGRLKLRGWVEGLGRGVGPGSWAGGLRSGKLGLGSWEPQLYRPQPSYPSAQPNSPTSTPLTSTLPTQPPDPDLSPLCGESSTSVLLQTFVGRLRSNSQSHSLCGKSSLWRIFCGKSSM